MLTLDPKELPVPKLHHYLLGSIGPRPIAFASTVDKEGNRNLAPFSFFNVFSANPPILIFSPARSGRTNTTKNTHDNVKDVAEVVINVVTYDMVHQMSLTSSPFEAGVDEFEKARFTPVASDTIRPYRVKESPVQIECKVLEVKELGKDGGAGNLVICEVQKIHIAEEVLDENQMVDQQKIDLVSRMGGNWYCRANDASMFEVDKPITTIGVGVDALPEQIRTSNQLTGNELGILGNMASLPTDEDIKKALAVIDTPSFSLAKDFLAQNKPQQAYAVLLRVL
ncbi:MAG: flavin reductase family protein [Bacteroidetes bacterium]|jgi:flavin reductase (DIM6/NTAB) family NADH-FMN oxidoreductase RutF|nr:flavin reductase family protein [Bacteroidota bacterium]MDA8929814.1 flavin reductase family protein [Bacteroidia bacterium]